MMKVQFLYLTFFFKFIAVSFKLNLQLSICQILASKFVVRYFDTTIIVNLNYYHCHLLSKIKLNVKYILSHLKN